MPRNDCFSCKDHILTETSGEIDYVICYPIRFKNQAVQGNNNHCLAVKFSKARLIDNIILEL